jgi:hypothetical protein
MSPRIYLDGDHHGWPWPVLRGGINGPIVFLECPTPAHYIAPTKACDLLRAKEWKFSCRYTGSDFPAYEKQMTTKAGTKKIDLMNGVTVDNEPGWETQEHVFERRIYPSIEGWSEGFLVAFYFNELLGWDGVSFEHSVTGGVSLLVGPWWDWNEDNLPVWQIPLLGISYGSEVEESASFCEFDDGVISKATGMMFLGETVGEPNPDWQISLEMVETFES